MTERAIGGQKILSNGARPGSVAVSVLLGGNVT